MRDATTAHGRPTPAPVAALAITLGIGLRKPKGKNVTLSGDDPPDVVLSRVLTEHAGRERWWSPFTFRDNHRRKENWLSASAVGIDLDYYALDEGHSAVPEEVAQFIQDNRHELPGSMVHLTPRGLRLILVFMSAITDRELALRASLGAAAQVERVLGRLGLLGAVRMEQDANKKNTVVVDRIGFIVDRGALVDFARMLWTPNAHARRADDSWEPNQRSARIWLLGEGPLFSVDELAAEAPEEDAQDALVGHVFEDVQDGALSAAQPKSASARVLAALAALPGARRTERGVTHRCLHHDDSSPSAITFESLVQKCSACNRSWAPAVWASTPRARELLGDAMVDLIGGASPVLSTEPEPPAPVPEAPLLFPDEAWAGIFAQYRDLVAGSSEYPDAAAFAACLACLSVLVGRSVNLRWGARSIAPIVNTLFLGATAKGRKSTSLDDGEDIIVEPLRPRPSRAGEPERFSIVNGSGSGEGFMAAIADARWRPDKDSPWEEIQGRSALVIFHEFGGLLEKVRREQAGNMVDLLLRAFDAPKRMEHRTVSKGVTVATEATMVIMGATTADWLLANLTHGQIHAGLANRFLWFTGPRGPPLSCRPPIDEGRIGRLQDRIRECLYSSRGRILELDDEARTTHDEFYAVEYAHTTGDALTDAGTARTDMLALRVAMLLAVGDQARTIASNHIIAGWKVAQFSRRVVESLVGKLEAQSLHEAQERVVRVIKSEAASGGTFSSRSIYQRLKGRHGLDAETFCRVREALVKAGDLVPDVARENWFRYTGGES